MPLKQFEIFKNIIKKGLKCSKVRIKFAGWGHVWNHVVCFTDIPLSMCDEHAAIYGKFGIGLKKSFVKNRGGNPARYFVNYLPNETFDEEVVENRGTLYFNLCQHFDIFMKIKTHLDTNESFGLYDENGTQLFDYEEIKKWINQQLITFSFEKETGDMGPARDETSEMDTYYREREWRLVPTEASTRSGVLEIDNKDFLYKFDRKDVNVIITPNNDLRAEVINFLLKLSTEDDPRLQLFSHDLVPVVTYDELHRW